MISIDEYAKGVDQKEDFEEYEKQMLNFSADELD